MLQHPACACSWEHGCHRQCCALAAAHAAGLYGAASRALKRQLRMPITSWHHPGNHIPMAAQARWWTGWLSACTQRRAPRGRARTASVRRRPQWRATGRLPGCGGRGSRGRLGSACQPRCPCLVRLSTAGRWAAHAAMHACGVPFVLQVCSWLNHTLGLQPEAVTQDLGRRLLLMIPHLTEANADLPDLASLLRMSVEMACSSSRHAAGNAGDTTGGAASAAGGSAGIAAAAATAGSSTGGTTGVGSASAAGSGAGNAAAAGSSERAPAAAGGKDAGSSTPDDQQQGSHNAASAVDQTSSSPGLSPARSPAAAQVAPAAQQQPRSPQPRVAGAGASGGAGGPQPARSRRCSVCRVSNARLRALGDPRAKLRVCARCGPAAKAPLYCSAACQAQHWPQHRGECGRM
jgi:hypothetical protein